MPISANTTASIVALPVAANRKHTAFDLRITGLRVRVWSTFRLRARYATGFGALSPTSRIYLPDSDGNLTPIPTFTLTPAATLPGLPTNVSVWALTTAQDLSCVL